MKKKQKLTSLAMLGIGMGLVIGGCQKASGQQEMDPNTRSFYEQLPPAAQKKFLELDDQHRRSAIQNANQVCGSSSGCGGNSEKSVQEQYNHQMQQRQQMKNRMN